MAAEALEAECRARAAQEGGGMGGCHALAAAAAELAVLAVVAARPEAAAAAVEAAASTVGAVAGAAAIAVGTAADVATGAVAASRARQESSELAVPVHRTARWWGEKGVAVQARFGQPTMCTP